MPQTSRKPKSQPGTSGPEETQLDWSLSSQPLLPPSPEEPAEVAAPVEESVKLSQTQRKLALAMSRQISDRLGLSARARSLRV